MIFPKKKSGVSVGRIKGLVLPRTEVLTDKEMGLHVHVVGASGYGKTVFLKKILRHKIEKGEGLLFIDLKGERELLEEIRGFSIAANRESDLQVFSLCDDADSAFYNPLENGSYSQLRDRVMKSLNWSEEYYKNQAGSFLLKVLMGLCKIRDTQNFQFGVSELLRASSDPRFLEEIFFRLKESKAKKEEQIVRELIDQIGEKDFYKSLQGLRSQLESMFLSEFGERLSSKDFGINLYKSVQDKRITVMLLDSRRYGELARQVGRFILEDLKAVSSRIDAEIPREKRKPFTVMVDEFSDLATEDFISFLDRARSSKMSVIVAHQEISDLERISKEFAGRLIGNMSSMYVFLQKRPESAEMISGIAGTRGVWKETHQADSIFGFNLKSGKKSLREVEEFVVHPNVIKSLSVGRCVVVKKYPHSQAYVVDVSSNGK